MAAEETEGHVYLLDGSTYIFRAFYAVKTVLTRPDGTPVNAVYGFVNMLTKLMDDTDAGYLAVVFDAPGPSFRATDIYPEYKANRDAPPPELVPQFELVREATRAFGVPSVEMEGYEADDLIATYSRLAVEQGFDVTIVSSDKDLMQLVGPRVRMFDPMKERLVGAPEVVERFGVGPDKVIDAQALAGDPTDNVPGVRGVGPKTAARLVLEYGGLDAVLERAGEIKQPKLRESLIENAELARISRRLVTLDRDAPVTRDVAEFRRRDPDPGLLMPFLEEQGFRSTAARMRARLGIAASAPDPAEPAGGGAAYELVQDRGALQAWVDEIALAGTVAVDTETTSLDPTRAGLVGVSLSVAPGRACYVPLGHRPPRSAAPELDLGADAKAAPDAVPRQIALDEAIALLRPVLEDPGVLKVGHNIKYDMHVLRRHGIAVAPVDDTMLLSYVLEGGAHGHGLDELARLHLDHANIKYGDVAGTGRSRVGFDEVPLDKALDYAAEDADMALRLHRRFKPRLALERMTGVYETLERPLLPVLADMERAGIVVDAGRLRELSAEFEARAGELAVRIHEEAGRPFNIGSPKQLAEVLFDEMGMQAVRKTKSGTPATDADVLETLAMRGHRLPDMVMEWRQLAKLKGTYADALVQQINPETGRVHTSYSQAVASTGRLSSNDPNLQNIPVRTGDGRRIRRAFVASDGCVLLSADYSQIELRLLAHVAGIESLRQAFRDGADIHATTASEVFGAPPDDVGPELRGRAKAINFGIIYGISPFGLARQLRVEQAQAKAYIEGYFAKFPGIRDYMNETIAFARENRFVRTIFGRKCHTPGIADKTPARRRFAERAAINAPLQGAAADIIKRAMIRVPPALARAGLGARMLLQVHDELVLEAPEGEVEETAGLVAKVMGAAARLDVPLVVDTGRGADWDAAH